MSNSGLDPEASVERSPGIQYVTGWRLGAVGVAIILSMFLASLDLTIIATAIPRITDDFHSLDDVGWYASALFLTVAASQSLWGKAYKYFPIKRVYLVSIAIFELGSLICGVAPNSTALIVGRAITGLGVAGTFGGSYIIIGVSAPEQQRAAMTGFMGGAYTIASIIGPLIGGALTDRVTWRWCFFINLPCGAVAAAAIILCFHVPEGIQPAEASRWEKIRQLDLPGYILLLGAVVCYLLAMQWGGLTQAWNASTVVGTLVGFGLLMAVFGLVQWFQHERALLPRSIFTNRTIVTGCAFSFLIAGNFYILLYYLPIYFQAIRGTSATESGIRTLPLILGLTLLQIVVGTIILPLQLITPFLIVGAALTTIGSGFLTTLETGSSASAWIGYQALAGIGLGICFTVYIMTVQNISKAEDVATATAVILFFQSLGGSLVVSAAQSIFQNELVRTLPQTAPAVDPLRVFNTGASAIQSSFAAAELAGIDAAYVQGIHSVFIFSVAMAGAATLVALTQPHIRLKNPAKDQAGIEQEEEKRPTDASMESTRTDNAGTEIARSAGPEVHGSA